MIVNQFSHLRSHPAVMLLKRHHVVIPSLRSRPRGRRYRKLKIRPPRLMRNQWYFQARFCKVNLVQITVSGLDLQRTWLRKGTDSPVVEFSVLQNNIYNNLSVNATEISSQKEIHKAIYSSAMAMNQNWRQLLIECYKVTDKDLPGGVPLETVIQKFKSYTYDNFQLCYQKRKTKLNTLLNNSTNTNIALATDPVLDRVYGIYSGLVLDKNTRYDHTLKKAYQTVRYSPLVDEGVGNMIWIDPISKKTNTFDPKQSKVLLQDMPVWLLCYGYADWIRKYYSSISPSLIYRVLLRCPYCYPKLSDQSNPKQGWVILGDDFCAGRMPFGQFKISPDLETRWYPTLWNQETTLENLANCGPWMPRDDESKSWQLNAGYKFYFKLGGTLPPGQPPEDPCKQPTHDLPESGILDHGIQVSDPEQVQDLLYAWDSRRSLFSAKSIKRVRGDQSDDDYFPEPQEKRWRYDPPVEGAPPAPSDFGSAQAFQALLRTPSATPGQSQEEDEEEKAGQEQVHLLLQRELHRQRQQQQKLKRGIQELFSSLRLTQMGYHIDQRLL